MSRLECGEYINQLGKPLSGQLWFLNYISSFYITKIVINNSAIKTFLEMNSFVTFKKNLINCVFNYILCKP